ncbi:MAG: hypothetical protein ACI9MR_001639 [Myxococcota bacterium]|jgi:hypothetical protein
MRFEWFAAVVAVLAFGACDESKPRPLGSTCTSNSQCEQGICGGGFCLDPALDEDADGLINGVEAALGTDPTRTDSDGDGIDDLAEVGASDMPTDTDGDGKLDAIESSNADADADCIPDPLDPEDDFSDLPSETFPDACGTGDKPVETVLCSGSYYRDTTAALLGSALDCFDPAGACINAPNRVSTTFSNGARIEPSETPLSKDFVNSSGTLCFTSTPQPPGASVVAVITLPDGKTCSYGFGPNDVVASVVCDGGETAIIGGVAGVDFLWCLVPPDCTEQVSE